MRIKLNIQVVGWSWKRIKKEYSRFVDEVEKQLKQKFPEARSFRIVRISGDHVTGRGAVSMKTVEVEAIIVSPAEVKKMVETLSGVKNTIDVVQEMLVRGKYEQASSELERIVSEIKEVIRSIST